MRIIDWIMLVCLAGLFGWMILKGRSDAKWRSGTDAELNNLFKSQTALMKELRRHGKDIRSLQTDFKRFTSVEAINDDMEIVADLIETRQADRLSMPRPNAGPPAIIHQTKRDDVYPVNRWLRKR